MLNSAGHFDEEQGLGNPYLIKTSIFPPATLEISEATVEKESRSPRSALTVTALGPRSGVSCVALEGSRTTATTKLFGS